MRPDPRRPELLAVDDRGAIRAWLRAPDVPMRWALTSEAPGLRLAAELAVALDGSATVPAE